MRGRAVLSIFVSLLLAATAFPTAAQAETAQPFIAPVEGPVVQPFNMKPNPYGPGSHRGIDYGVPSGTAVKASGEGRVKFAGPVAGAGLFVTVEHRNGLETTYSYLSRIDVTQGRQVKLGSVIAASGDGHDGSGQPALHFGAKRNGKYIDPETLFRDFSDITEMIEMKPVEEAGGPAANVAGTVAGSVSEPGFKAALPQLPQSQAPGVFWFDSPPLPSLRGPRLSRPTVPNPPGFISPTRPAPAPPEPQAVPSPPPPDRTRIPTSTDPLIQAAWWDQLTASEREAFIESNPRAIGRLEGVPPVDRDRANRIALAQEIVWLDEQLAAARAENDRYVSEHGPMGKGVSYDQRKIHNKIRSLVNRKRGAEHLWEQLHDVAATSGGTIEPEDVLLLEFDTSFARTDGRAVVAIGDPSKADYVGVVVPGVSNQLENFENTLIKAANLRRTVERRFGEHIALRTSTIAWLGYDTPESVGSMTNTNRAVEGGFELRRFVDNLRSLRDNGRSGWTGPKDYMISVFGHSYGSTTGAAAAYLGMSVHNLAVVGSPGGFAETAGELKGASLVWAGRVKGDYIGAASAFQHLGKNPMSEDFGAIEIPMCCERVGHGDYFQRDTRSVDNLAAIMVGRYDEIR